MEMVAHVLQAKNEGKHSVGVSLDLSKAFDTLDHPVLIAKLERYGIRGNMLDWFKSYLSGRSLVAKITNSTNVTTCSEKYDVTFSTVQGSCLGSLLFVIFCNDIYVVRRRGCLAPRQPLSVCALLPAYEGNRHLRPLGNLGHRLRRPRWID